QGKVRVSLSSLEGKFRGSPVNAFALAGIQQDREGRAGSRPGRTAHYSERTHPGAGPGGAEVSRQRGEPSTPTLERKQNLYATVTHLQAQAHREKRTPAPGQ